MGLGRVMGGGAKAENIKLFEDFENSRKDEDAEDNDTQVEALREIWPFDLP